MFNELCLALKKFCPFFSKSSVVVWTLINDSCLCRVQAKGALCHTQWGYRGCRGLVLMPRAVSCSKQKASISCISGTSEPGALEPRHLTLTFRLGSELLSLGGCTWVGGGLFYKWEFPLTVKDELSQRPGGKGLQGYKCSFCSLENEWILRPPVSLWDTPGFDTTLWSVWVTQSPTQRSHPHNEVTHTCCWHQGAQRETSACNDSVPEDEKWSCVYVADLSLAICLRRKAQLGDFTWNQLFMRSTQCTLQIRVLGIRRPWELTSDPY